MKLRGNTLETHDLSNRILFAKIKDNAIIPTKRPEDAGYDIYACIDKDVQIMPHSTVKVPTGIISAFSSDKVAILKERSSTGTKGLEQRCGVIDSGYRGEWLVPVTNGTDKRMVITSDQNKYMKELWITIPIWKAIAQAIILDLPDTYSVECTKDEIMLLKSERGAGGFGSTGK